MLTMLTNFCTKKANQTIAYLQILLDRYVCQGANLSIVHIPLGLVLRKALVIVTGFFSTVMCWEDLHVVTL